MRSNKIVLPPPPLLFRWVIGGSAFILLIWFFAWYNPSRGKAAELKGSTIPAIENQIATGKRAEAALPGLRSTVEQRRSERATLFELFPSLDSRQDSFWLERIYNLRTELGVQINPVTPREVAVTVGGKPLKGAVGVNYQMTASGSFGSIYSLVRALENINLSEQYSSLSAFSLQPTDPRSTTPGAATSFQLTLYYYEDANKDGDDNAA